MSLVAIPSTNPRFASHHITFINILDWMNRKTQRCDASRWNGTIQLFGGGFALVPFGPQEFLYCMEPSAGKAIFSPQLLSDEVPNCSPFHHSHSFSTGFTVRWGRNMFAHGSFHPGNNCSPIPYSLSKYWLFISFRSAPVVLRHSPRFFVL